MSGRPDARVAKLQAANTQLKSELNLERVPVSQSSNAILDFCSRTRDPMVPSVWGRLEDKDNPYAVKKSGCTIL